jgi:hypothetical protein
MLFDSRTATKLPAGKNFGRKRKNMSVISAIIMRKI